MFANETKKVTYSQLFLNYKLINHFIHHTFHYVYLTVSSEDVQANPDFRNTA